MIYIFLKSGNKLKKKMAINNTSVSLIKNIKFKNIKVNLQNDKLYKKEY